MFNDAQIQNWIEEFGTATSFTFLIYGTLRDEELSTIVKGLIFFLEMKGFKSDVAVFVEYIDEHTYDGILAQANLGQWEKTTVRWKI